MKKVSVSGSPRENVGKKDAKALRLSGKVPCVLYGGKEQVTFFANELELEKIINTPDVHIIDIQIGGKNYESIIQEIQFHVVNDRISHIDFMQIFPDKPVKINIPVNVSGNSVGVREGGKLIKKMRQLKVKALPKDLPDSIEIKVDDLKIGDSVRVADMKIGGIVILENPKNEIVGVKTARAVEEAAAEAATPAAGAAPAAAAPAAAAPAAAAKAAPKK